jgi:two-component system chemotaxis response regulator CheY
MPGKRGVDFLIDLVKEEPAAVKNSRKVLFTGQAGHEDTIEAINHARIEHYLAKPWERGELEKLTRKLLTDYVLESNLSPLPYMSMLDQERVVMSLHDHPTIQDV